MKKTVALCSLAASLVVVAACSSPTDPAPPDPVADTSLSDTGDPETDSGQEDTDVEPDTDEPEDTAAAVTPVVSVGTYNVKLFFDTICQSGFCGDDDFEDTPTNEAFNARADEIAAGIEDLGTDIVLLQEVENQTCLNALVDRLGGAYPTQVLGEIGSAGSVDVAVLSSGELLEVVTHRATRIPLEGGGTTTFARELLEVHLDYDGQRVIAISVHFVSHASDEDGDRRLAEANAAHFILTDLGLRYPQAIIVLGGDINDTIGTPPSDALSGDGVARAGEDLSGGAAATYFRNGEGLILDQLWFVESAAARYVPGSGEVVRTTARGLGGSDHAGMRATFGVEAE